MAALTAACRVASARMLSGRALTRAAAFSTSARCLSAQNFVMPALSPTMTEGNIATWKVKEGDSFSAGDVLLEIETDKATMDVEAQEDGIMVKIMSQDGSKSVPVGTRIAVLAEAGDDIKSLEIPADEQPEQQASGSAPKEESTTEQKKQSESKSSASSSQRKSVSTSETQELRYPLLPSVGHLVTANRLSEEDLGKIKPTGPGGRLLKGDVLAYLGTISADVPASISTRFDRLSHLDLTNIKVAEKEPSKPKETESAPETPVVEKLEVNIPISLAKVVTVQRKIQDSLGVFLPLSTFISRATEVANDDLPLSQHEPTTSELFDAVLGLDKVKAAQGSRGIYMPQVSAIPPGASLDPRPTQRSVKRDIIDELVGRPIKASNSMVTVSTVAGLSNGANVFSLAVPKAEVERAQVFLQRCKLILEEEPGRLVL